MPMDDDLGRNNANVRGGSAAGQEARGGGSPGFGTGGGGSVGGGGGYGGGNDNSDRGGGGGGGGNDGGGNDNSDRGGGGGGEAAREAVDKASRRAAERAADDARAKATQDAVDRERQKAKDAAVAKEAADQKAREAAAAKAGEERRAREAADQKAREAAAAKAGEERRAKEAADQKAREAAAAKAGEERRAKEAAEKATAAKAAADKVVADQKAREAAFAAARDAAIQATETANRKAAADRAAALKYMQEQAPSTGPTGRGGVAVQKGIEAVLDRYTGKTIKVESGGDPNAQNPKSSAAGLGQFTEGTWLNIVNTYRPDLMVGRTEAEILALRFNPEISVEMTKNLAKQNAEGLTNAGFPVNESTLYLSHFLGLGGAIKMLNAPADAPASVVAGGKATKANQSILGGTKTAADVLSWASNKMDGTTPFNIADLDGSKLKNQLTNMQDKLFGGSQETVSNDQKGLVQYADANTTTSDSTEDVGSTNLNDTSESESNYFYDKRGFNPVKSESESNYFYDKRGFNPVAAEKPWYDKLVSVFDSTPQIEALEDQNRLAGGLTKQEYADLFAGGDSTKVQSRIVDYGQGQQVDYYTKSLGDKFGEAASDLGKSISNAGKGITSLLGFPASETSTAMQPLTTDPFAPTGLGPGGDLTRDQYRDQYGGSDIATNLPPTGASTTTPPPVVPPVVPTEPVMPTVPNFAAAQQYIGTPTVATPGFNFLMPFAPRPPIDFANLGQAYAPTALASAPPLQPLPGIPGAMYSTPYQRLG